VVTAGNLEDETRYEYTVMGDTVNEAARLSDLANSSPSGIAASAEVVEVGDGEGSWQPPAEPGCEG
jgi:adenylate cyclase